jgi:integrase
MADEIIPAADRGDNAVLVPSGVRSAIALMRTADLWANATTDPTSGRRRDLIRDKTNILLNFFEFVAKPPAAVTPEDVRAWQIELERAGLKPATVYAAISRVSSFYTWALTEPRLAREIKGNPVNLARPKAPKPYQSESTKALSDDDLQALLDAIRAKFESADPMVQVVARRDYALLLFYLLSGMRRSEIIRLRWGDLKLRRDGSIVLETKVKGGTYLSTEIADPNAKAALLEYLRLSGRLDGMTEKTPLWVAHDRAQTTAPGKAKHNPRREKTPREPGQPLTAHSFARNLKDYAREAGLNHIHLHQTRHTFARLVSDEAGSLTECSTRWGIRTWLPPRSTRSGWGSRRTATVARSPDG